MKKKKYHLKQKYQIILLSILIILVIACFPLIKRKIITKPPITTSKITTVTTTIKKEKKFNLTVVGDLLFENPFYNAINKGYDYNSYFSLVKDYFTGDDLSIGNMEVVIGNSNMDTTSYEYNFCAPEYIGNLVNTLGFEVLSTANNHAYDRGITGLNSSLDFFRNKTHILTVGTYKTKEERETNHIITINSVKFGFLSYTYRTNNIVPEEYQDLIAFYRDPNSSYVSENSKARIKQEVDKLKQEADVIIVIMHWGYEFQFEPNSEQLEMANFLNSLGVDIIVGSHSHNMQPVEIIGDTKKTLVFYSLGNFVSADPDLDRTSPGNETFDNAYQIGLLGQINLEYYNHNITFKKVKMTPIINYFDKDINNFKLIPLALYDENYEKNHYRYSLGLNNSFITSTFNNVIKSEYH